MRRFYLNFVGNAHFSYFVSLLFWLFIVLRTIKKQHFFFRRIDGMRSHSTENDWFGWQHIAHSDLVGHTVHIAATGRSLWKMHIPMITFFHKSDGFLRLSIPKSNNTRDWWLSANIIAKRLVWLLLLIFFFLVSYGQTYMNWFYCCFHGWWMIVSRHFDALHKATMRQDTLYLFHYIDRFDCREQLVGNQRKHNDKILLWIVYQIDWAQQPPEMCAL